MSASREILDALERGPGRIAKLTADLTVAQLHKSPAADAWCANDVLAHLRCCADVWGGYMRRILDENAPTIRATSPRGYIKRTNYLELKFATSLDAFREQRSELIARLAPLTSKQWSRTATVKASGNTTTLTVLDYAQRLADHEHHHFDQFARIASVVRP